MACNSIEINNIMYVVRNILTTIMIIAPILAIISLAILFTKKVMNPDEKGSTNKIKNVFNALVILFFIPTIVNVAMYMLGENTSISSCYTTAQKPGTSNTYQPINPDDDKINIINDDPYEEGYIHQLDFSCTSKHINAQFSCDTIKIVEHHYQDFNYYTKDSVMAKYGGFDKYIASLGGFFEEYYMKDTQKPEKAYDFQKISEYVFGLIYIHGFDYYNGSTMDKFNDDTKYCKWGGSCIKLKDIAAAKEEARKNNTEIKIKYPEGSSDAFYPGDMIYGNNGYMSGSHFDREISKMNMTTNCNNTVDMVYYKAKILGTSERPYSSADYKKQASDKKNKIITKFEDVQIGDILHFYDHAVDPANPSTWSGWKHVAYVGEINYQTGVITAYDGGSYLTSNRNHKWTFNRNQTSSTLHGYPGWSIIRVIDLK